MCVQLDSAAPRASAHRIGGQSFAEPGDVRDRHDGGDDGGQVVGKRGWKQRGREGVAGGQEIGAELEG